MPNNERARAKLYEALLKGGPWGETIAYAKTLGEGFRKKHCEALLQGAKPEKEAIRLSKRDPSVTGVLVKRLGEKLLPVPRTEVSGRSLPRFHEIPLLEHPRLGHGGAHGVHAFPADFCFPDADLFEVAELA